MKTTNQKLSVKKRALFKKKVGKVMHEFKAGELHIGKSESIVTNPKQAIAIALSEAREITKKK